MKQETRTRKYAAKTRITGRLERSVPNYPVPEMTPEEWETDQQRQKAILAGLIARAQAHVPSPANSVARQAYRDSPLDEILVEKFRKQGFNL